MKKQTAKLFLNLALITVYITTMCSCSGNRENQKAGESTGKYKSMGHIERLDPALDKIVDAATPIEVLDTGFVWTEGPLWVSDGNYLLFSDIPPNKIYKWDETNGLKEYLHPSGYTGTVQREGEPGSNGLILDDKGRLVMCQHGDRRIARMDASLSDPKPVFVTLADKFEGKRLNSPNDAVYHSNGDLYFTDPPYGLVKNMEDSSKEIPFQGVYRLSKDGKVSLLSKELSRPNGIALTPDEKKLYVANSDGERKIWMVFDLDSAGQATHGKIFCDATSEKDPGAPDGMKIDKQGNIFATGPGGVWIFNPEGKVLGKIHTTQLNSNCAFNADQTELFITADDFLVRVKLKKR